jgi:ribosome biogenesis SPOUT family RNA methylase Rps3
MKQKTSKKTRKIFIIEHLEKKLFEWCLIEYENISKILKSGKNKNNKNDLWFTNIKNINKKDRQKLKRFGRVFRESVKRLDINNSEICVLDPEASKTLNPNECDNFRYFIFGGILGDYPPKKRTKKELTRFFPNSSVRNIGKEQMSTDNAVYTVQQIIKKGKKLNELKFVDGITIEINEFESVDLPYLYNLIGKKPFLSKELIRYLRKKKGF